MYETVVSFIGVNHCKPQENHFLALYIQYVLVYKIIFITLFPETLTLASWCFWDAMMKMKAKVKVIQSSLTLQPHGLHGPWNSPGQDTEASSLSLLEGIFPTQGSSPGLPHCRQILYQLSRKGNSDENNN